MKPRHQEVAEWFIKHIANHKLTVRLDQPGYRHLSCSAPNTGNQRFDIITYPGVLVYSGDMGCYVFSRITDMLEFFRDGKAIGAPIGINPSYWGEKLLASCGTDGHKEYCPELFKASVIGDAARQLRQQRDDGKLDRRQVAESIRYLRRQVLACADDGEHAARKAAHDFTDKLIRFDDFYETNLQQFTVRYLWCCRAIVWAIREYDALKVVTPASATS